MALPGSGLDLAAHPGVAFKLPMLTVQSSPQAVASPRMRAVARAGAGTDDAGGIDPTPPRHGLRGRCRGWPRITAATAAPRSRHSSEPWVCCVPHAGGARRSALVVMGVARMETAAPFAAGSCDLSRSAPPQRERPAGRRRLSKAPRRSPGNPGQRLSRGRVLKATARCAFMVVAAMPAARWQVSGHRGDTTLRLWRGPLESHKCFSSRCPRASRSDVCLRAGSRVSGQGHRRRLVPWHEVPSTLGVGARCAGRCRGAWPPSRRVSRASGSTGGCRRSEWGTERESVLCA